MPPRQRPRPFYLLLFATALTVVTLACDRENPVTAPAATQSVKPTVASLSPAATDLLIGMGAADHLVAVSNWDAENPQTASLPRVGDYRSIDRERLTAIRPDVVVVQFRADKLPPGVTEFV